MLFEFIVNDISDAMFDKCCKRLFNKTPSCRPDFTWCQKLKARIYGATKAS